MFRVSDGPGRFGHVRGAFTYLYQRVYKMYRMASSQNINPTMPSSFTLHNELDLTTICQMCVNICVLEKSLFSIDYIACTLNPAAVHTLHVCANK